MVNSNIMLSSVHDLQETIVYQFQDSRSLLKTCRTAGTGYHITNSQSALDGSKSLAYLGEAVLKLILLENWYLTSADRSMLLKICPLLFTT